MVVGCHRALASNWQKDRRFPGFAKAVKVRRLVGSSTGFGVGIKVGVCVAGPSVETWFLAYLLI